MEEVKNILLVTNSVTETELSQIQQAIVEAKQQGYQLKITLVHVIPNLPTCYFNIPSMVQLAEQYYEEAKRYLTTIGDAINVAKANQWLITGRLKPEVLRLAGKLDADYILASSSHIQELQQALTFKKEHLKLLFRNLSAQGSL